MLQLFKVGEGSLDKPTLREITWIIESEVFLRHDAQFTRNDFLLVWGSVQTVSPINIRLCDLFRLILHSVCSLRIASHYQNDNSMFKIKNIRATVYEYCTKNYSVIDINHKLKSYIFLSSFKQRHISRLHTHPRPTEFVIQPPNSRRLQVGTVLSEPRRRGYTHLLK